MGTALSDFGTASSRRGDTLTFRKTGGATDVAVELLPTPHADQRTPERETPLSVEVMPAERSEMASRIANVVIALVAFVVLLPVMALVALAVRLTSRGPV